MKMRGLIINTLMLFALAMSAQPPSFALYQGAGTTVPILNGSSIPVTTTASAINFNGVKILNISANTVSLSVIRTITFHSPQLNVTPSSKPSTYFCFGNACFPNYVNTVTGADYTILLASGNTNTTFPYSDDSDYNNQPFKIYLEEGGVQGKYYVNYKVYNVNNSNDSISFTIKYNNFLGVNEAVSLNEEISELYPNPAQQKVSVTLNLKAEEDVHVSVINQFGQVIHQDPHYHVNSGKQEMQLNTSEWAAGIYRIQFTSNGATAYRKLIISK